MICLSSCNDSWTWHQKITVSVSTPGGIKTASSVIKASLTEKGGWWAPPEATGATRSLSGEAVVLEVAPGRFLFALLNSIPMAYEIYFPGEAPLEVAGRLENSRETRELNSKQYPLLVTFGDISDPASVERVDPAHLETSFGPGYRLIFFSIEITDEPVSRGQVAKILGWLPDYYDKRLDGQRFGNIETTNALANSLASGDFDTEKP